MDINQGAIQYVNSSVASMSFEDYLNALNKEETLGETWSKLSSALEKAYIEHSFEHKKLILTVTEGSSILVNCDGLINLSQLRLCLKQVEDILKVHSDIGISISFSETALKRGNAPEGTFFVTDKLPNLAQKNETLLINFEDGKIIYMYYIIDLLFTDEMKDTGYGPTQRASTTYLIDSRNDGKVTDLQITDYPHGLINAQGKSTFVNMDRETLASYIRKFKLTLGNGMFDTANNFPLWGNPLELKPNLTEL